MFWELCQALERQDKQNRVSAFKEFSITGKTNLEPMPANDRVRGAQALVTRAVITRYCRLGGFPGLKSGNSWVLDRVDAHSPHFCLTPCNLWTVALQALLSIRFSRQEHWSGLPFPPPGDLPAPGIEPESPVSPALAGGFLPLAPPGKSCPHSFM